MRGSRNFRQGGGVQVNLPKKALTTFFSSSFSQLILQKSNGLFQRKLSFFKVSEEVQHFPGGGGGRGVQLFPGGGGGPIAYSL